MSDDALEDDLDQIIDILQKLPWLESADPVLQGLITKFYDLTEQAEDVLHEAIAHIADEEDQPQ